MAFITRSTDPSSLPRLALDALTSSGTPRRTTAKRVVRVGPTRASFAPRGARLRESPTTNALGDAWRHAELAQGSCIEAAPFTSRRCCRSVAASDRADRIPPTLRRHSNASLRARALLVGLRHTNPGAMLCSRARSMHAADGEQGWEENGHAGHIHHDSARVRAVVLCL